MNPRIPVLICALALSATAFAADPKPAVPAVPAAPAPAVAATPGMGQQGHPDEHMQSMMKECMARQGEERKACQDKMKAGHMKSMDGMKGMKGMKGDMKGMQGDHAATPATPAAPATPAMPSDHDHQH